MDAITHTLSGLNEVYEYLKNPHKISITTLFKNVHLASEYSNFLIGDNVLLKTVGDKPSNYKWHWIGTPPDESMAKNLVDRFNTLRKIQYTEGRRNEKTSLKEINMKLDAIMYHFKITY